MTTIKFQRLAVPGVSFLICFLAYTSQYLFNSIAPGPLITEESLKFNLLVGCIWICYARACLVDPGKVPQGWKPPRMTNVSPKDLERPARQRWCRKCEGFKPPRAHHCKTCRRCIPKMDHHCPWTNNCVSYWTFPHFFRFILYAVLSLAYLEYFLFVRAEVIWNERSMPAYLGPSGLQLTHLFVLMLVNSLTLFALSILLIRTTWSLVQNTTTIEGWEIERHATILRRARVLGGYLEGPDGQQVRIRRQEFPYDIGFWKNLKQAFGGSANVLSWLFPFASTPDRHGGLEFEINGFEDESLSWPPPDPDRIPRYVRPTAETESAVQNFSAQWSQGDIDAFKNRQELDLQRRQQDSVRHRQPFHERFHDRERSENGSEEEGEGSLSDNESSEGEEGWTNSDGDRLRDFGVDEETEFYDEDDVPLAELLQRRRANQAQGRTRDD